jgi:hypothetical protein
MQLPQALSLNTAHPSPPALQIKAVSRSKTALRSTYSADLDEAPTGPGLLPPGGLLAAPGAGAGGGASPAGGSQSAAGRGAAAWGAAAVEEGLELPPPALAGGGGGGGSPPRGGCGGGGTPPVSPRGGSLDARSFSALLDGALAGAPGGGGPGVGGSPALPPAHLLFGVPSAAARGGLMRPKGRYLVLLLDSADGAARLGTLLSARGRGGAKGGACALAARLAGAAGASVGIGVASAYGLHDTLRLLGRAGLGASDADFLITNAGSQIWYTDASSAAAAGTVDGAGASGEAEDLEAAARRCVPDHGFDAFAEHAWDKLSVRRVLAQLLAQRGLLPGLAAASVAAAAAAAGSADGGGDAAAARAHECGGSGAGSGARLKVSADTETGAHHLLLALRREGAPGGSGPTLGAAELAALVARVRKRFRCSGLRTNGARGAQGPVHLPVQRVVPAAVCAPGTSPARHTLRLEPRPCP